MSGDRRELGQAYDDEERPSRISVLDQSLAGEIVSLRAQLDAKTHEAARWREIAESRYHIDDLERHRSEGAQEALEAARDQIMSQQPIVDQLPMPSRQAFRNGFANCRYRTQKLINDLIRERVDA